MDTNSGVSSEAREVVRCANCSLNQFMTRSGNCRKCHEPLKPELVEYMSSSNVTVETESQGVRHYQRAGCDEIRYLVPDLPTAIYILRHMMRLSQRDLALRMRKPRTYVSKVENRKSEPTLPIIDQFAAGFGIAPRDLINLGLIASEAA